MVALVVLTTKLFPKGQPYLLEFPWITFDSGKNVVLTLHPVELVHVYIVGALFVLTVWFYKSRLFIFITRPPVALLQGALPILFCTLMALFWILLLPIWLLALLIEIPFFLVWKSEQNKEDLEKWRHEKGGLRKHAREDMTFRAVWVTLAGRAVTGHVLAYLFPYVSWVSISFANISTFSSDEELLAPKVALQAFSEAWVQAFAG